MFVRRLTLLLIMAALVIGAIPAAAAAQKASGSFVVTSFVLTGPPTENGNTCVIEADATFSFTGTLEGDAPMHFRLIQSAPCTTTGPQAFTATGTFTGTVAGQSGSYSVRFQGHIDRDHNARGQLVIPDGTDALADLHGHLTLTGDAGVGGTYDGTITFAA